MRSTILPIATSIAIAYPLLAVEPVQTLAKADVPKPPSAAAQAADTAKVAPGITPEHAEFFESKVRPILAAACYKCHSAEEGKAKGGLTLDTREGTLKGGDNGAAIVPGDPSKSSLVVAVTYNDPDLQMPPKGEKLKDEEIAILTQWVKMGAPDPRKTTAEKAAKLTGLTDKAKMHWAFQPVKKPEVPKVKNATWCQTPVDFFIQAKYEEKGLMANSDMSKGIVRDGARLIERDTRGQLLRRASFDLLGLPPSPAEMDAFIAEADKTTLQAAFANAVERMLASPHYGERWGRYWLNTSRYADTIGGDRNANNRGEDYRYPFAWTYRDWVIRAFNQDMPYDKFIVAQLAADRMPETKRDPKLLSAMGFLTVGERFRNVNDEINDRIDVVTKGFLGLTVACARCHDHMFDPIPTKDYYALHGVFASIDEPEDKPLVKTPSPKQVEEFNQKMAEYEQTNRDEFYRVMEDWAGRFREKAGAYLAAARLRADRSEAGLKKLEALQTAEKLDPDIVQYMGGRMGRGDSSLFNAFRKFAALADSDFATLGAKISGDVASASAKEVHPVIAAAFKGAKVQSMQEVIAIYNKAFQGVDGAAKEFFKTASKPKSLSDEFDFETANLYAAPFQAAPANKLDSEGIRDVIAPWPLRMRGQPRFTFGTMNSLYLTHPGAPAKAMVVADKPSPQDSRVFIRGQSQTQGDVVPRRFLEILSPGNQPSPFTDGSGRYELAKAIASKDNPLTARVMVNRIWMHHFGEGFVRTPDDLGTQSEKPTHPELIDFLSSYFMENGWSIKAVHRLIMNSHVYRLSSEALSTHAEYEKIDPENRYLWRANFRRLDFEAQRDSLLAFGGSLDRTVGGQPVNLTDEPYSKRRSVYGYIDRGNLPELMTAFDFSDPAMPNTKRTSSIVPQQALFLMNSSMAVDAARKIIARPEVANARDGTSKVFAIHKLIFQRTPEPSEIEVIYTFLNKERNLEQFVDDKAKAAQLAAAEKKNAELESKMANQSSNMRESMFGAIRNEGEIVDRRPLNGWETYAQALLLSNEAAYVN